MDEDEPSRNEKGQPKEDKSSSPGSSASSDSTLAHIVTTGIRHPGKNDVMFGRGGDTNYHIGNNRFRTLADTYRQSYREASRKEKTVIVQQLVDNWRAECPPGRFLTRTDPSHPEESLWHDVGNEMALKKAAKILTEKASSTPRGSKKRQMRATKTSQSAEESGGASRRQRQPSKQPPSQQPYEQRQQPSYPLFASLPQAHYQVQQTIPELSTRAGFSHVGTSDTSPQMFSMTSPPLQFGFRVAHSEPGLNLDSQQEVPMSHQQPMPAVPLAVTIDHMREQQGFLPGGTPVQQQRLHFSGIHPGASPTGAVQYVARATLLSEQDAKDDSPPIATGAADAVPTAASLAGVFNSSNSSASSTIG